jgi:hypothetical protein
LKSTDIKERDNAIRYLAQKAGRQISINGGILSVRDLDGKGESPFDLNDNPEKIASALISAFGVDLPEDTILKFANQEYKGNRTNTGGSVTAIVSAPPTTPIKSNIPISAIKLDSVEAAKAIQATLPFGFKVNNLSVGMGSGDNLELEHIATGKKYPFTSQVNDDEATQLKIDLDNWVKETAATASGVGSQYN